MAKRPLVQQGEVIRTFYINKSARTRHHDEILDDLLDEPCATASESGHTGFVVTLADDKRADAEIIDSLSNRMAKWGR